MEECRRLRYVVLGNDVKFSMQGQHSPNRNILAQSLLPLLSGSPPAGEMSLVDFLDVLDDFGGCPAGISVGVSEYVSDGGVSCPGDRALGGTV